MSGIDDVLSSAQTKLQGYVDQFTAKHAEIAGKYPEHYKSVAKVTPLALALLFFYVAPLSTAAGLIIKTAFPRETDKAAARVKGVWESYQLPPKTATCIVALSRSRTLDWIPRAVAAGAWAAHRIQ